MSNQSSQYVLLDYAEEHRNFVEAVACRLRGDARLSLWFSPWHSVPGEERQQQMEAALLQAHACAVFVSSGLAGFHALLMRAAIQQSVEAPQGPRLRVIPVLVPGAGKHAQRDLPPFLRLFESVEFRDTEDPDAFRRLLAGILGLPPVQIEGYIEGRISQELLPAPSEDLFAGRHALVIGIAGYANVRALPSTVLADAQALHRTLISPCCGYDEQRSTLLLDQDATGATIRASLGRLASACGPNDTALVYVAGHGVRVGRTGDEQHWLLPVECDPNDLVGTAIHGRELMTLLSAIPARHLLLIIDCAHSDGAARSSGLFEGAAGGWNESYFQSLAAGRGCVVIAACRPDEQSLTVRGMPHSLFTTHLIEALQARGPVLGDGYVRVFDLFRHLARQVSAAAARSELRQHPLFKAAYLEADFPIAFTPPDEPTPIATTRAAQRPSAQERDTPTLALQLRRSEQVFLADLTLIQPDGQLSSLLAHGESVQIDQVALLATGDSEAYGRQLTSMLFRAPGLKQAWAQAVAFSDGAGGGLHVRLALDPSSQALQAIAWETLRDPDSGSSLVLDARRPFARAALPRRLAPVLRSRRSLLRATVVIASPHDAVSYGLAAIPLAEELERARAAFGVWLGGVVARAGEAAQSATPVRIRAALQQAPDVLYLLCHGRIVDGMGYLCLEHEDGSTAWESTSALVNFLSGLIEQPLLVILASCYSAGDNQYDPATTLGPALVEAGIPAVVGLHGILSQAGMAQALPVLMRSLQQHGRIDQAMVEARATVTGDERYRFVLWLRTQDAWLFR